MLPGRGASGENRRPLTRAYEREIASPPVSGRSTRPNGWWYQTVTAGRTPRISVRIARVSGSEKRARAGVEAGAGPAEEAPALRGVAVEVDAVRVLPGVTLQAVGVEVAHEEQLDAGRRRRRAQQVDDLAALGLVAVDAADDEHLARRRRVADAHDVDRPALHRASEALDARRDGRLTVGARGRCGERDGEGDGDERGHPPHRPSASVVTTAS